MEQTIHPELVTELTTDDPVEIKKLIDQYFEAIRRKNENIARNWVEIERLKVETQATLDQLGKIA